MARTLRCGEPHVKGTAHETLFSMGSATTQATPSGCLRGCILEPLKSTCGAQMGAIQTESQLTEVIGEKIPGLEDKVLDHLDEYARAFIERSPFAVLSTASADGRLDASPKGDAPGFIAVLDAKTIAIPDRPGNRLAYGHRNVLENPRVGLLMMIPGTAETLRINGVAELSNDESLLQSLAARGKPAVLAIRVAVEEVFFHCGKAFIRSGLWKPEEWGDRHRVSFGEMYAAQRDGDAAMAEGIDAMIEQDYQDNL